MPAENEAVLIVESARRNIVRLSLEPHSREGSSTRPLHGSVHQTTSDAASSVRGIDCDVLDDSEAIPALGHGGIADRDALHLGDEKLRVRLVKVLGQLA